MLVSIGVHKQYFGGISTENEAAKLYDRKSIATFGLKAKTNYSYSKAEIIEILQAEEPVNPLRKQETHQIPSQALN